MKGMILKNGARKRGPNYSPSLKPILSILNGIHKEYNWLITNYDCFSVDEKHEIYVKTLKANGEPIWITGEELDILVTSDEELYWIWGVLSAFEKEVLKDEVLKYDEPWADGYTGFWKNPVSMQHPLAEIEIVPWDGLKTLFISKDDKYMLLLKEKFPEAQDLEEYNEMD